VSSDATQDGDTVTIAGLVTSVQHRVARQSGNQYGMIQVEDFSGEITVMFMGKAYQEFAPGLQADSIVGRARRGEHARRRHEPARLQRVQP
jgi:DNA polymerase-3 subunit alpha